MAWVFGGRTLGAGGQEEQGSRGVTRRNRRRSFPLYHLTAQSLRSTVRPYDSDGDGLLDEDPGEDLHGDGRFNEDGIG